MWCPRMPSPFMALHQLIYDFEEEARQDYRSRTRWSIRPATRGLRDRELQARGWRWREHEEPVGALHFPDPGAVPRLGTRSRRDQDRLPQRHERRLRRWDAWNWDDLENWLASISSISRAGNDVTGSRGSGNDRSGDLQPRISHLRHRDEAPHRREPRRDRGLRARSAGRGSARRAVTVRARQYARLRRDELIEQYEASYELQEEAFAVLVKRVFQGTNPDDVSYWREILRSCIEWSRVAMRMEPVTWHARPPPPAAIALHERAWHPVHPPILRSAETAFFELSRRAPARITRARRPRSANSWATTATARRAEAGRSRRHAGARLVHERDGPRPPPRGGNERAPVRRAGLTRAVVAIAYPNRVIDIALVGKPAALQRRLCSIRAERAPTRCSHGRRTRSSCGWFSDRHRGPRRSGTAASVLLTVPRPLASVPRVVLATRSLAERSSPRAARDRRSRGTEAALALRSATWHRPSPAFGQRAALRGGAGSRGELLARGRSRRCAAPTRRLVVQPALRDRRRRQAPLQSRDARAPRLGREARQEFDPHVVWGLGDTAYADGTEATNFVDEFYDRVDLAAAPDVRDELLTAYRRMYRAHWSFRRSSE